LKGPIFKRYLSALIFRRTTELFTQQRLEQNDDSAPKFVGAEISAPNGRFNGPETPPDYRTPSLTDSLTYRPSPILKPIEV
jgi:hypothetical protein